MRDNKELEVLHRRLRESEFHLDSAKVNEAASKIKVNAIRAEITKFHRDQAAEYLSLLTTITVNVENHRMDAQEFREFVGRSVVHIKEGILKNDK